MAFVANPLGQDNATGSAEALFLTQYAGEVLVAYDEAIRIRPRVTAKRIMHQKSATFPLVGKTSGTYHTRGEDILTDQDGQGTPANYLKQFSFGEKEVFVDDLFLSPTFVSELDEMKLYYSARAPIARKQGMALAVNTDTNLLRCIVLGAQAAAPLTDGSFPGGNIVTSANALTDGGALLEALFDMAAEFDTDDVPSEGRACALPPAQYYNLVKNQDLLNRQYGGSNGIFSKGTVFEAAGFELVKTNLVPTLKLDTGTAAADTNGMRGTTYNPDATNTVALCWHPDGVATVRMMDVSTEVQYWMPRQGHILLAKMVEGHDHLIAAACGQIRTAAP